MENKRVITERILDAVHKSLDWKDGEITGYDAIRLEQHINGILGESDKSVETNKTAETIPRYELVGFNGDGISHDPFGELNPNGEWVKYEDHLRFSTQQPKEKDEEIKRLIEFIKDCLTDLKMFNHNDLTDFEKKLLEKLESI